MNDTDVAHDEVAEWLRRWTANPLGSARVGSNPILVEEFLFLKFVFLSFWGPGGEVLNMPKIPLYDD